MEIFGFSVICSIFSYIGMKFKNMTAGSVIRGVIDSAGGEALEELLEKVIETFFPKLMAYIPLTRQHREKRSLAKDVNAALKGLSEQEVREMLAFFSTRAVRGATVDLSDAAAIKALAKQLKKQLKESKEALTNSIVFIEGDALVRKVYDLDECETVPVALQKLSEVISRHVYEQMYLGLSSDDRDLAKVVQIMLVENNGRVADTVKDTVKTELRALLSDPISIILQHHEDGTLATLTGRGADGTAPTDPFFYVKLVCPDCGACGDNVHRHGERVFCRCCGGSYNIVENAEPKVVERIDRLEASLLAELEDKLKATGTRVSAQMRGQLREMAEQMVGAEYFDSRMNALAEGQTRTGATIMKSISDNKAQLQGWLDARLRGVSEYLKNMQAQSESDAQRADDRADRLQQGLVAVLQSENRAVQVQLASIQSGIDTLGAQNAEMLGMMQEMARLGIGGVKLSEASLSVIRGLLESIREEMKKDSARHTRVPAPAPVTTVRALERTCPTCGNLVNFGSGRELVCPDCGSVLNKRTAQAAQNPPVPLEIAANGSRYAVRLCVDGDDLDGYDVGTAVISLRFSDAGGIRQGNVSLTRDARNLNLDRVILRTDSACGLGINANGEVDLLSSLLVVLRASSRNLKKLVLGANVSVIGDAFVDGGYQTWKRVGKNVFKCD